MHTAQPDDLHLNDVRCRPPLQPAHSHRGMYLDAVYDHNIMQPVMPGYDNFDVGLGSATGGELPFGPGPEMHGTSPLDWQRSPGDTGADEPYHELPGHMRSMEAGAPEGAHRPPESLHGTHSGGWTAPGMLPRGQQHGGSRFAAGLAALLPSPDGTPWQAWLAARLSNRDGDRPEPSGRGQAAHVGRSGSGTREGGMQGGLRARYGVPAPTQHDDSVSPQSPYLDAAGDMSPSRLLAAQGGSDDASGGGVEGTLAPLRRHEAAGSTSGCPAAGGSLPSSQRSMPGACVPVTQGEGALPGEHPAISGAAHPQGRTADALQMSGSDDRSPVLRFASTPQGLAGTAAEGATRETRPASPKLPHRCVPQPMLHIAGPGTFENHVNSSCQILDI